MILFCATIISVFAGIKKNLLSVLAILLAGYLQAQPVINSFLPTSAKWGDTVVIKGKFLLDAQAISFGGTPAYSAVRESDSVLKVIVGTGSSGNIIVTTPQGSASVPGFTFIGTAAVVSSFTPNTGVAPNRIFIRGRHFTTATAVSFGGVASPLFNIISDTTLSAVLGNGASGNVAVTNAYGTGSLGGFQYVGTPTIDSFSPMKAGEGVTVEIKGKNFTGTYDVIFNTRRAKSFSVVSDSLIRAVVYGGDPPYMIDGFVGVRTASGDIFVPGFTYDVWAPYIDNFFNKSAPYGETVVITGGRFLNVRSVLFGGVPALDFDTTRAINDHDFYGPKVIIAKVGYGASGDVTVITDSGMFSMPGFTYILPPNSPTISSFYPSSGEKGAVITIKGSRFTGATIVSFGESGAFFTVESDSVITAIVGNGRTGAISITTPTGKISAGGFTYIPPTVIKSFSPSSATVATTVIIKGKNFLQTNKVLFGAVPAVSFSVLSDSLLHAVVGTGATGKLTVMAGNDTISLAGFTYILPPPPQLTSFDPVSGQSGSIITIKGKYLSATKAVAFGGIAAASFTVLSDTAITAIVGDGKTGILAVTTSGGIAALSNFIYTGPSISTFSPTSANRGTVVTIYGANFTGTTAVSFGGTNAESFTVVSDATIQATVGAGASGNVLVKTSKGTTTREGFTFTDILIPAITSFSPASGPAGTVLTIMGSGFNGTPSNNIVQFGAMKAKVISAAPNQLTVIVPAGVSFGPISVTTSQLTSVSSQPFIATFADGISLSYRNYNVTSNLIVGASPGDIEVGDLDNDGKPDLVIPANNEDIFSVYRNISTPTQLHFAPRLDYNFIPETVPGYQPLPIQKVVIKDIDGDGKSDLVVMAQPIANMAIFRNTTIGSNISFTREKSFRMDGYSNVMVEDLNADGKPDLLFKYVDTALTILLNTSQGGSISFDSVLNIPTGTFNTSAIADINGDQKPDILGSGGVNKLAVLKNTSTNGIVSFTKQDFAGDFPAGNIAVGDINADGKPDLVVANETVSKAAVFINTGNGSDIMLENRLTLVPGSGPVKVRLADLDGDGKPDLSFPSRNTNSVSIFKNTSTGGNISFAQKIDVPTIASPRTLTVDDIDGDGEPDLMVSNIVITASKSISIIRTGPVIKSFSPSPAGTGTPVTLKGINFTDAMAISFGDTTAQSFNVVSDSVITAIVGNGHSGYIGIKTPKGTDTIAGFIFIDTASSPRIISFTPTEGASGTVITITGKKFTGATKVSFGDTLATSFTVVSDSVITATVGTGASGYVSVTTAKGTGAKPGFTYIDTARIPKIISFTPTSGATGTIVTIKGKYFTGATLVSFGDSSATSFTVVSDSVITATVGAGASGNVAVTTSKGKATLAGFIFNNVLAPVIYSFTPTSAAKGTTVTIKGKSFTGTKKVNFGVTAAAFFTVISDSVINAIVGNGSSGSVQVVTDNGSGSRAGFIYLAPAPFELLKFTGTLNNAQVALAWETRNEDSISYYQLERGADTVSFTSISKITPLKALLINQYSFIDQAPPSSIAYYRLRMVDSTGKSTFSKIFAFQIPAPLSLYPNPADAFVNVIHPISTSTGEIKLIDTNGGIVLVVRTLANTDQTRIHFPAVMPGIYRVVWTDGNQSLVTTLMIQ